MAGKNGIVLPRKLHGESRRLHLHRQTHLREAPDFSSLQAELQGFGGRLPTGPRDHGLGEFTQRKGGS